LPVRGPDARAEGDQDDREEQDGEGGAQQGHGGAAICPQRVAAGRRTG
jgi:hypothetical protein